MMKNTHSTFGQLLAGIVFAVLTVVALYIFVTYAEPPERKPNIKFDRNYDEQPLVTALTESGRPSLLWSRENPPLKAPMPKP